jgi:hypothetical protein
VLLTNNYAIVVGSTWRTVTPVPTFDIFRGHPGNKDVMWTESVEGLAAADERMKVLAAETPGPYFVFSLLSHAVLGIIDTTYTVRSSKPLEEEGKGAA